MTSGFSACKPTPRKFKVSGGLETKKRRKENKMTLYDYIKQTEDWENTVFDKDYDIEVYFYKNDDDDLDSWDKSMEKLSKLLTVDEISKYGVTVNLSELIESKLENLKKANLFIITDIDSIMDCIESVISGNVSEEWMEEFVKTLEA